MKRKMIKAIRLVNGYNDNLRVKLPYKPGDYTAAHTKIQCFILDHLMDLYGVGIMDKLGTTDTTDIRALRFAADEARDVLLGEAED